LAAGADNREQQALHLHINDGPNYTLMRCQTAGPSRDLASSLLALLMTAHYYDH